MKMRLLAIVLVVVLLFAASATMAFADGCNYSGHCTSNFNLSRTWNKVSDRTLENFATQCYLESSGANMRFWSTISISTSFYSNKWVNPSSSTYADRFHETTNTIQGTARANVENYDNPGSYMRAVGQWYIYNGATQRVINY
jgi:hypothetical protein